MIVFLNKRVVIRVYSQENKLLFCVIKQNKIYFLGKVNFVVSIFF